MSRKILVVTGSRADYGLLRCVMGEIKAAEGLDLQVLATGMHLSPEFGQTYQEIEQDGFLIDKKVELLLSSDTSSGIAKSMGLGLIGIGDALRELKPDLMLVLGDRFEIFAAVAAALVSRVPVAHLHGGELTEGAFDDAIRHSITKMSHLHFVATDEYRNRVIQLGEQPDRVFVVGGMGIDNINNMQLLTREELEQELDFCLGKKNLLITFHPVTLGNLTSADQMEELLFALDKLEDTHLIFTMPNSDNDGRALFEMVNNFVKTHPNSRVYTSLGQLRYLSCIKHVDGVVGNSSSGLMEVPSFGKGTINIGDRQQGRIKAASVIDAMPDRNSISEALTMLYSSHFRELLRTVQNPYGQGGANKKVVEVLLSYPYGSGLKKMFYDLP